MVMRWRSGVTKRISIEVFTLPLATYVFFWFHVGIWIWCSIDKIFLSRSNVHFVVNTQWLKFRGLHEDNCEEGDYQSIVFILYESIKIHRVIYQFLEK